MASSFTKPVPLHCMQLPRHAVNSTKSLAAGLLRLPSSSARLNRFIHITNVATPSTDAAPAAGRTQQRQQRPAAGPATGQPGASAAGSFEFACPICLDTSFTIESGQRLNQALHCVRCQRTFSRSNSITDLTLTSGITPAAYKQSFWPGTQIFQTSAVSFAYERGWRQSFASAGFPGPDEEFRIAMDYLKPAHGKVLLDVSCGSGLFSRRFVGSKKFDRIVASDFSENMLKQAGNFFAKDLSLDGSRYSLLRADVGRLPFKTGTLAGIHAGAALHCWPNPLAAMAEISRVLEPGGVFVATTFLKTFSPLGQIFGDSAVQPLNDLDRDGGTYKWWTEPELRDITASAGLVNFQRFRRNRFIMLCVQKPGKQ